MEFTNNYNLPQAFVDFARNDKYSKGKADISVTTLIDSPRVRILREKHHEDRVVDVVDNIWALFGTAVHHVLESTKPSENVIVEERLFTKVDGWVLSGAIDHQKINGQTIEITDYKVTSVWSVIHGKIDWERQLNVYAYLVQKNKGKRVTKLSICAILRDWNRKEAQFKPDYPQAPVVIVDIPMWDEMDRIKYIHEKMEEHRDAQYNYDLVGYLPACLDEEMWKRGESWAVKKKGLKRAMRVFDNQGEAEVYAYDWERNNDGKIAIVEHRAGEAVRCSGNYCGVAEFCSQFKGENK
tara:strand:- start:321 stop:1208 length:888 start_codon:yes stop_codon:yes gene_type:complete